MMEKDSKTASNFWSGWVHFHQAYELCTFLYVISFPGDSDGKDSAMRKTGFNPWVGKVPWRKELEKFSSILAWRIPRTVHAKSRT